MHKGEIEEKRFPLLDEEGWREAPGWCSRKGFY